MDDQLSLERLDRIAVLSFRGNLTLGKSTGKLRSALQSLPEVESLLIDLTECQRLDSAGLGELVACYASTKRKGIRLLLCSPNSLVREIVLRAGLEGILLFSTDRASGLAELRATLAPPAN